MCSSSCVENTRSTSHDPKKIRDCKAEYLQCLKDHPGWGGANYCTQEYIKCRLHGLLEELEEMERDIRNLDDAPKPKKKSKPKSPPAM